MRDYGGEKLSVKPVYQCDGLNCTETRKEVNHWFVVLLYADSFSLMGWRDDEAADELAKHYCGQACVQKFVEGWMNSLANSEVKHNEVVQEA